MKAWALGSLAAAGLAVLVSAATVLAAAPPCRYLVLSGVGIRDRQTGLTWQANAPAATYDQAGASTYCQALPPLDNAWRLPSRKELDTIVDRVGASPLDPTYFQGGVGTYWSSTKLASDSSKGWAIDFTDGHDRFALTTEPLRVRCVTSD